ncbi:ParB/RepB/Spo0J family partition protein [Paracoccus sanguinis]|uniref:Chromosome partitioning protein, ParB family n=1 Tax=Paracoccus sanguinis TaxID=1545044 RepID=A0A1H3CG45_9RHOB|nr:ParB/RepB/Spo0J family partition protein [Paracoccus sanguinis]KGJ18051.1 DNA-binding protein [Paracoccus sanguinis]SDX52469.1 chromosome partitioning protein, ParB family [Paracoccus sanguinis]
MAIVVQKITLSSSRDIPFNKLILSQTNVRTREDGISIEDLAASIARRGLIQSPHVRPVLDADGAETGMFDVPAGGRRYRALELLVKQKRLARTAPVPCVVGDAKSAILAEEVSLAENIDRLPLTPLEQFRAFAAMLSKGMSEEEIAAAFLVQVQVVKQRLRLLTVWPALLEVYEAEEMTLEQLMAFTVSSDHARKEQVWESIKNAWSKEPYQIRRMLTEQTVRASDKRAVFVGLDTYEAAGGATMRDLFQDDDGGWLQDPALLEQLVTDKLKVVAEEIAREGWKWVAVGISFPYGATNGLRELVGIPADLTADEQAAIEALKAEYDRLEAEYEEADELPDEIEQRLGELETALATFDNRPVLFDTAEVLRAGVFISIDANGTLDIDRGYVRPEDEVPLAPEGHSVEAGGEDGATEPRAVQRAVVTIGGEPSEPEEDDDAIKPLPERLVTELTAHRTLALRDAVAGNPHVAMTALLHKLVTDIFLRTSASGGCLEASVRHVFFPAQPDDLKDSPCARSVAERHEGWKVVVPAEDAALWDWIAGLDDTSRMALLAHCVSYGVNALVEKVDRYGGAGLSQHNLDLRLAQADRLARVVGLDMVDAGWRATSANYLGRVTKARILQAVREVAGEQAVQLIDRLKKGDMAKEAERLLADSGWLPEPLRLVADDTPPAKPAPAEPDAEVDLPRFLAGDGEDDAEPTDPEEDPAMMIAAE